MNQHKDESHWNKKKSDVEKILKDIQRKRERTLYLYNIERQTKQQNRELQLRALLDYETKEMQKAQLELKLINSNLLAIEKDSKKYNSIRVISLVSLFAVVFIFMGMIAVQNFSDDLLTGAVVSVPGSNCLEKFICINQTLISCKNETIQRCDANCANQTIKKCGEECKPICKIETINKIEREVCVKSCSEVCTAETVQNCGNCDVVTEEKCTSEIVEQCDMQLVCDELIKTPAKELEVPSDQDPQDDVTSGMIAIPDQQQNELTPLPREQNESAAVPEEDVDRANDFLNNSSGLIEGIVRSKNMTEENISEVILELQITEEETYVEIEEITTKNVPTITLVLNSTNVRRNNTDVNLTAYNLTQTDGNSLKIIYNWLFNASSLTMLNVPFEGINGSAESNTWDYSGFRNNGTVLGAAWNLSGGYDRKGTYMFDGIDDFINVSSLTAINLSENNLSISVWIKHQTVIPADPIIIGKCGAGNCESIGGIILSINPNGTLTFRLEDKGGPDSSTRVNDSRWHHVAGTFSRSNKNLSIYVDGVLEGFRVANTDGTNNFPITIGGVQGWGFFNGSIDEVMIFNRTLSGQQIYALSRNQTNVIVAQETEKGDLWKVQATPNNGTGDGTMVASDQIKILVEEAIISNLTLNSTDIFTNNTNANLTAFITPVGHSLKVIYNWLLNGSTMAILNMPFEEINGTAYNNTWDYSGLQTHGNGSHSAIWNATGGYDEKGAYQFNGINARINITNQHYFESICNTGCTFGAWVKVQNHSDFATIIGRAEATDSNSFFTLAVGTNGQLRQQVFSNGSAGCTVSAGTIPQNEWKFTVGRYNGTDVAVFVDGIQPSNGATACSLFTSVNYTAWQDKESTFIGGRASAGPTEYFNGTIDEVMIWNRSLSSGQIYALWKNQTDLITASQTNRGENWTVQATANNGTHDGTVLISNTLTIPNSIPAISVAHLNSTNISSNNTKVNLTAYINATDIDNDLIKVIYNWIRNNNPIAILNMPFEGINGSLSSNSWDYSGKGNDGFVSGAFWNGSGGYDSKGVYVFDGLNDYINITSSAFTPPRDFSLVVWTKKEATQAQAGFKGVATTEPYDPADNFGIWSRDNSWYIQIHGDGTDTAITSVPINYGKWTHLALIYDSSSATKVKLYINGSLTSSSANNPGAVTSRWLKIGDYSGGTGFYNGSIDEIFLFNRSLTTDQVIALYRNKTYMIVPNETVTFENWSVQATPNDGQMDGAMFSSANITILNTKSIVTNLTLNSTDPRTNDTSANLTASFSSSDFDNERVKNITNWKLNGGSFAIINLPFEINGGLNGTDYAGFENNITSNEGALYLPGGGFDGRGAYNFSPATDHLILNWSSFPTITGDYAVEAWVKTAANKPYQAIFSVNNFDPAFYVSGANKLRVYDGGDIDSSATTTINDNNWHHVAFVRSGTTVTFYLDGNSYGTATHSAAFPTATILRVGYDGTGAEDFDGVIDELRVYNYSLTSQQINAHFHNQTSLIVNQQTSDGDIWSVEITPHDGLEEGTRVNSNNITITGAPIITIVVPANHSVYSSGSLKLNFTATDPSGVSSCWYSVNNGTNNTIPSCFNTTIYPGRGTHNIVIYANDSLNFVGSREAGNITTGAIPNITALVLNTTNPANNNTDVNLTAYHATNDADNNSIKVIYNWYRNSSSLMVVNMPFEQINGTNTSNFRDYTGYNNIDKVTLGGTPYWNETGGHDGKGAYVVGSSNYISIANATLFDLKNFTYVVWIRADAPVGFQTIIDVDNDEQYLGFTNNQYLIFGRCGSNAHGTVKTGIWTQLAWSVNGSTYQIYENATLIGSGSTCSGGVDGDTLNLGSGGGGNEFFVGTIDDVKIFNVSLTHEQIAMLYFNKTNEISRTMTETGENWTVQGTPNDGYDDGLTVTSNNVTISDAAGQANTAPPAPVLVSPLNGTTTTSRTPTFIWNNSVDADNDFNISYRLEIDNSADFSNPEVNVSGIINTTNDNTTYTISTELSVDTTYFWRVFAFDQTVYGVNSSTGNFTVQSYLAINVTADTIAFGTFSNGQNISTPNNASPFRAENVGNIIANVTITGTPFFNFIGFPSTFYQFRVRANESGAFNTTSSTTDWTQMNTTSGAQHVVNLDWHSISNDFLTDLNLSVPGNESAGSKSSTVTFTITG